MRQQRSTGPQRRVSLRVAEHLAAAIDRLAYERGCSMNTLYQEAVRRYVKQEEATDLGTRVVPTRVNPLVTGRRGYEESS